MHPDTNIAISLPIGLDIELSSEKAYGWKVIGNERGLINIKDWTRQRENTPTIGGKQSLLKRSTQMAKELWRMKHGNNGQHFRNIIKQANVSFNFQYATEIIAP